MLYCIEVKRGGVGEEDFVDHHSFKNEPTEQEVIDYVKSLDCGWQDGYCKVDFYRVG